MMGYSGLTGAAAPRTATDAPRRSRWTEQGAEAVLQLRADYLSDGDVMAGFWQRRQAAATGQRHYRTTP